MRAKSSCGLCSAAAARKSKRGPRGEIRFYVARPPRVHTRWQVAVAFCNFFFDVGPGDEVTTKFEEKVLVVDHRQQCA